MSGRALRVSILIVIFFLLILSVVNFRLVAGMLIWLPVIIGYAGQTSSDHGPDRGVFYHFTAKYLLDRTEPLNFDLLVGCSSRELKLPNVQQNQVRKHPNVYARRTINDHVVMIAVPDYCDTRQTILDEHDGAFMPLAIWFESSNNLEMGLGYSTIQAYERPASRLSFLGASVRPATREEFEEWNKSPNENLISNEMVAKQYWAEDGWLRNAPAILPDACYSIALLEVLPAGREVLEKYWPEDHPDYWSNTQIGQDAYNVLYSTINEMGIWKLLDRLKLADTRLRMDQGKLRDGHAAPETVKSYPAYFSDSVPSIRSGDGKGAPIIRVDTGPEFEGFSACYRRYIPQRAEDDAFLLKENEAYFKETSGHDQPSLEVNGLTSLKTEKTIHMETGFFLRNNKVISIIKNKFD
ncbi:hypothetical protein [Roseibium sediminis]|uniref:hypothetical protein n=1 Tax=Roseibium sediminis TaxID=1775174 RepID=UPI00123DF625|nr:hypothetical protein [Roseibium sediminis]